LQADHSFGEVLPNTVCLNMIVKSRYCGDPGPLGAAASYIKKNLKIINCLKEKLLIYTRVMAG